MNVNRKMIAGAAMALLLGTAGSVSAQSDVSGQRPKAYLVSDAHLDTQWNWDIQTTIKDYVWNTINQNLFLLKKYPNYVFNFEGGVKYAWMKEYYPQEYLAYATSFWGRNTSARSLAWKVRTSSCQTVSGSVGHCLR